MTTSSERSDDAIWQTILGHAKQDELEVVLGMVGRALRLVEKQMRRHAHGLTRKARPRLDDLWASPQIRTLLEKLGYSMRDVDWARGVRNDAVHSRETEPSHEDARRAVEVFHALYRVLGDLGAIRSTGADTKTSSPPTKSERVPSARRENKLIVRPMRSSGAVTGDRHQTRVRPPERGADEAHSLGLHTDEIVGELERLGLPHASILSRISDDLWLRLVDYAKKLGRSPPQVTPVLFDEDD